MVEDMRLKPRRACPACQKQHMNKRRDGKILHKNRLSVCEVFHELSLGEKAELVEKVGACSLCLDWTGTHNHDTCTEQRSSGQGAFKSCARPTVNGALCGRRHHEMLHGASEKFCFATRAKLAITPRLANTVVGKARASRTFAAEKVRPRRTWGKQVKEKLSATSNEVMSATKGLIRTPLINTKDTRRLTQKVAMTAAAQQGAHAAAAEEVDAARQKEQHYDITKAQREWLCPICRSPHDALECEVSEGLIRTPLINTKDTRRLTEKQSVAKVVTTLTVEDDDEDVFEDALEELCDDVEAEVVKVSQSTFLEQALQVGGAKFQEEAGLMLARHMAEVRQRERFLIEAVKVGGLKFKKKIEVLLEKHTETEEEKLEAKVEKREVKVPEKKAVGVEQHRPNPESSKPRKWPFSKLKSARSSNSSKSVMKGSKSEVKGGADPNRLQVCDRADRAEVAVQAGARQRDHAGDQLGGCSGRRWSTGDWRPSQTRRVAGWTVQDTKANWRERS